MEVNALSNGNSELQSTWSGVPYYLLDALERKGVKVNRIDMSLPNKATSFAQRGCNRIITEWYKRVRGYLPYNTVERYGIFYKLREKHIKKQIVKYADTDCNIVFDYSTDLSFLGSQKWVMLCDWPIDYVIKHQGKRQPNCYEKAIIDKQYQMMSRANSVITLFPKVREHMQTRLDNVLYLGNGINAMPYDGNLIDAHYNSRDVLFIGGRQYLPGANLLCEAVKYYNERNKERIILHVVGVVPSVELTNEIKCYGILNKDIPEQRELYYSLLKKAKLFCNPSPNWSGAQSIMEAMYYQLPIVVCRNEELQEMYGKELSFGKYCSGDSVQLADDLKTIMQLPYDEYATLCNNAQNSVKEQTWNVYAEKLLNQIMIISGRANESQ